MQPITQKEIARATGLSKSTVSMALRNDPNIAAGTRRKVLQAAARLGYQRNPMLGALCAYRDKQRAVGFHGLLAWLFSSAEGPGWQPDFEYRSYYEGASARAAELGYRLLEFDLNPQKISPAVLARVLHARGIHGALVGPLPTAHNELTLPLDQLSVVAFGYTLESPQVHRVTSHHYDSMLEIMRQLRSRGYQRIGFCVPTLFVERLRGAQLAAFWFAQTSIAPENRIPPCEADSIAEPADRFKAASDWLEHYQPDALIVSRAGFATWPHQLRAKVESKGIVGLSVDKKETVLSGIDECSREIGRVGAQFLISLVEHGEMGVPATPQHVLIKSRWHEGSTVRSMPGAASMAKQAAS